MKRVLRVLYQPYKWFVFLPLFISSTIFFVGLGAVIVALKGSAAANRTTGVWWARFNAFITPLWLTVYGKENIDKNQSYVIVSNHQSLYDIFVLYGWLGIDIKWVMKKELRKVPVFGYAGQKGGNIYIDRSNPAAAVTSLNKAKDVLKNGTSVIILPEGTRSLSGNLIEFKKGAFVLALDLGMPILPITIINTRNILPPKTFDLFPGRATMAIHHPVDVSAYRRESIDRLVADIKGTIQSGLDQFSS